jgi:hypothetical protein
MPELTDPERLAAYRDALSNWSFQSYIQFELTEESERWLRREIGAISLKDVGRLMHEYVAGGGIIDEVAETRPEWSDQYEFHYDLRFRIDDVPAYIETRLIFRPPFVPDEPWILVVNIHAP